MIWVSQTRIREFSRKVVLVGRTRKNELFLNFKACSLYAMYMLLSLKCVDKLDSLQKITFAQYFLVLDCLLLVALKHKRACRLLNNL